jgi:hypothetical protein
MRRLYGPLILALVALLPAALVPLRWPLFVGLAAVVLGVAIAAVRSRSSGPVIWAVLGAGAAAATGVLVHRSAAGVWEIGLGLLLLLGAELTYAATRSEARQTGPLVWHWEYLAAALSALALSALPRVSADFGTATSLIGLAAIGALVALLVLLVARSPR